MSDSNREKNFHFLRIEIFVDVTVSSFMEFASIMKGVKPSEKYKQKARRATHGGRLDDVRFFKAF